MITRASIDTLTTRLSLHQPGDRLERPPHASHRLCQVRTGFHCRERDKLGPAVRFGHGKGCDGGYRRGQLGQQGVGSRVGYGYALLTLPGLA